MRRCRFGFQADGSARETIPVVKFDVLRQAALSLPEVEEGVHRGGPAFKCRGKTFALWWAEGERTIMKLDPYHQTFLFEVRPEIFAPCKVGMGVWSYVDLQALDDEEIGALTKEAWRTVAPRRPGRALE